MTGQASLLGDDDAPARDWRAIEAGEAHFSEDRLYRYGLKRVWDARRPVGLVIGLNPSTADENTLDATLRRCIRFADREGWGGFWMANLFALRATKPAVMKRHHAPVGEPIFSAWVDGVWIANMNDWWLRRLAASCPNRIIFAWGAHGTHQGRAAAVTELLDGHRAYCFGLAGNGMPRHPLMLHRDTPLVDYRTGG